MGEYAQYNGNEIKIGTWGNMYYLRFDQVGKVYPLPNNLDPRAKDILEVIRFRFPFPEEDNIEPGAFENYQKSLGISGVEPPEEINHYSIQFSNHRGLLVSLPCPESKEGKETGYSIGYNGYAGKVRITQQAVRGGKLVLVCECGSCGSAYNLPEIEDVWPILDALSKYVGYAIRDKDKSREAYYNKIIDRIKDGYINPPAWITNK